MTWKQPLHVTGLIRRAINKVIQITSMMSINGTITSVAVKAVTAKEQISHAETELAIGAQELTKPQFHVADRDFITVIDQRVDFNWGHIQINSRLQFSKGLEFVSDFQ